MAILLPRAPAEFGPRSHAGRLAATNEPTQQASMRPPPLLLRPPLSVFSSVLFHGPRPGPSISIVGHPPPLCGRVPRDGATPRPTVSSPNLLSHRPGAVPIPFASLPVDRETADQTSVGARLRSVSMLFQPLQRENPMSISVRSENGAHV